VRWREELGGEEVGERGDVAGVRSERCEAERARSECRR